jgi:hypothetical protein
MTRLTLSFGAPQAVVLTQGPVLSLSFPPPQAVALQVQGIQGPPGSGGGGGGGVTDGDKGDITVSGGGTVWTIDAGAVTLSDMANLPAGSILGNNTGSPATPIALTPAQVKTLLAIVAGDVSGLATIATSGSASDLGAGTLPAARFNDTAHGVRAGGTLHPDATTGVSGFMSGADKTKLNGIATGATANATDAALRDRATHTGTQTAATISDFSEAVDDRVAVLAVAGTNMTITYNDALGTLTFDAAGGGGGGSTNLAYDAATRVVSSDTGTDATLTLADGTNAGLMTSADFTKLGGVATGATANSPDATLLARANHTGTQLASTISNFAATVIATVLTGFAAAGTRTAIVATDTILVAFGKVQKYLNDLAAVAFSGSASDLTTGTLPNARLAAFGSGDVSFAASGGAGTIAADAVTNAKLANMATATFKGRTTAGTGDPEDLTAAQATALLNNATTALKGLVPAPGTASGNFLRDDLTWAASGGGSPVTVQDEGSNITTALGTLNFVGAGVTVTGGATATVTIPGGSGSPGGSSGEIQFNNAGAFGGAADVEIEGGQLRLPAIAVPTAPAAGGLKMFASNVGGRILLASIGPRGLESPMQPHIGRKKVVTWNAQGGNTNLNGDGLPFTTLGTGTVSTPSTTNFWSYIAKLEYLITTAVANAIAQVRSNTNRFTAGGTSANLGGFHAVFVWGPATGVATTTHRAFCGMRSTAAATDVETSTITNMAGMGWDAADTNIQFMHNDGSGTATKIDLGASFPVPTVDRSKIYRLTLFSPPGLTQSVGYEVEDLGTGAVATGTVTTDLPSTATMMAPSIQMTSGGTLSVIGIAVASVYIETDY